MSYLLVHIDPHNPPEVADFMIRLGESDFDKIPHFLGYTEQELLLTALPFERKVELFLDNWKMPSTGNEETNTNLLTKLASVAGSQSVCPVQSIHGGKIIHYNLSGSRNFIF